MTVLYVTKGNLKMYHISITYFDAGTDGISVGKITKRPGPIDFCTPSSDVVHKMEKLMNKESQEHFDQNKKHNYPIDFNDSVASNQHAF